MPAPDFTSKYNTKLGADDEKAFQDWAAKSGHANDLSDYDLRGWWKSNGTQAANGHLTDKFKKPNHPTFSTESQYSGKDGYVGGKWSGDDKAGWSYTPSKSNLKNMTTDELQDYFSKVEPKSKLVLPQNAAEKRYGKGN